MCVAVWLYVCGWVWVYIGLHGHQWVVILKKKILKTLLDIKRIIKNPEI